MKRPFLLWNGRFCRKKGRVHKAEDREDLYTLSLIDVSQILPILGGGLPQPLIYQA